MSAAKKKQLDAVIKRNMKDLDNNWNKYKVLCKREGVTVKELLTDASYYSKTTKITFERVATMLENEINALKEIIANKEAQADPSERAAKRQKLEDANYAARGLKCDKCNSNRVMYVYTHSNDSNDLTFPTGYSYQGYLPNLPGLGCGDAISMNLCVECGHLVGFNREIFLEVLDQVELNDGVLDM
jgi:hypothetical protein